MDEQLNLIEANPPAIQKALYQVSRGPVGQATSSGISAAARLTVAATKEAVKVAAPLGKCVPYLSVLPARDHHNAYCSTALVGRGSDLPRLCVSGPLSACG